MTHRSATRNTRIFGLRARQAMRTKSSRSFMSSEWQGSYQRDEAMLLAHTGVGASGLGATPDSRSCAPPWIEPTVYQVAFQPPDLETMQVLSRSLPDLLSMSHLCAL